MRISTRLESPIVSIQYGRLIWLVISSLRIESRMEKNGFDRGGGSDVSGSIAMFSLQPVPGHVG